MIVLAAIRAAARSEADRDDARVQQSGGKIADELRDESFVRDWVD